MIPQYQFNKTNFEATHTHSPKTTATWSWYCRQCGYSSSILDFPEQRIGERASDIMFEVPAQIQLQKLKQGRMVATPAAVTVLRQFCCQSFEKWVVPCMGMNILAWCTMMYL